MDLKGIKASTSGDLAFDLTADGGEFDPGPRSADLRAHPCVGEFGSPCSNTGGVDLPRHLKAKRTPKFLELYYA